MELSIEVLDQVEELVFDSGFSVDEVALYLQLNPSDLRREFQNKESEFYKSYRRGLLRQKLEEDKALSEACRSSDTNAIQIKMKRDSANAFAVIRDNLIDGNL